MIDPSSAARSPSEQLTIGHADERPVLMLLLQDGPPLRVAPNDLLDDSVRRHRKWKIYRSRKRLPSSWHSVKL
jgi:hypothetical protein